MCYQNDDPGKYRGRTIEGFRCTPAARRVSMAGEAPKEDTYGHRVFRVYHYRHGLDGHECALATGGR